MTDAEPNDRNARGPAHDDRHDGDGRDERDERGAVNEIDEVEELDEVDERESVYELFHRGAALLARRHHAQAAVVLERAARLEPGKGSILEALGRAYYNSGQWASAGATFEALLDLDPSAHYAQYGLGMSLKKLGRIDEARTCLRLAVALSPESALYREALGRLPPAAAERPRE